MFTLKYFGLVVGLLLCANPAFCEHIRVVDLALKRVFIPDGFNSNNQLEFVVKGDLPAGHKVGRVHLAVDLKAKKILVRQVGYIITGQLIDSPKPSESPLEFSSIVYLDPIADLQTPLEAGQYVVMDQTSLRHLGIVQIYPDSMKKKINRQPLAPILEVKVTHRKDAATELTLVTWAAENVPIVPELLIQSNTIVVLPVLKGTKGAFVEGSNVRHVRVKLPHHLKGEYLLHVRSHFPEDWWNIDTDRTVVPEGMRLKTFNKLVTFP